MPGGLELLRRVLAVARRGRMVQTTVSTPPRLVARPQSSSPSMKRSPPPGRPRPRRRACHRSRRAGAGRGRAAGSLVEAGVADTGDLRRGLRGSARRRARSRARARRGAPASSRRAETRKAGERVEDASRPRSGSARQRLQRARGCPATTPAITSWWPPRYFVADSQTRSAPSSSGRQSTGDAKVLSTIRSPPPFVSASAGRSASGKPGLAIVST